jgi:hypothetical protein
MIRTFEEIFEDVEKDIGCEDSVTMDVAFPKQEKAGYVRRDPSVVFASRILDTLFGIDVRVLIGAEREMIDTISVAVARL